MPIHTTGICSVCSSVRCLRQDGSIRAHGPYHQPCPGAFKPPSNLPSSASQPSPDSLSPELSQLNVNAAYSSQPSLSQTAINHTNLSINSFPVTVVIPQHPTINGPIIKHIPKSARVQCCIALGKLIDKVFNNHSDISTWISLLNFGSYVLIKLSETGTGMNLSSSIKSRAVSYVHDQRLPGDTTECHTKNRRHKTPTADEKLARLVTSKIEDGNLRSAMRILSSDDTIADNSDSTYQQLLLKHPKATGDLDWEGLPSPTDPSINALQVSEADVIRSIRSFPPGSAGGPDGIRPKHLIDLINCRETG